MPYFFPTPIEQTYYIDVIESDLPGVPVPSPGSSAKVFARGRLSVNDGYGGSFSYREGSTVAIDNGVWFQVGSEPTGRWERDREDKNYWHTGWYGVVGDDSTDNFAKLTAMGDTIIATNNEAMNTIEFPAGIFRYSQNIWIANIKHFTLRGVNKEQTTLRNTEHASAWVIDKDPLWITGVQSERGKARQNDFRASKTTYGFTSAIVGDKTVTFTVPGNGSNFVAGDEVFVSGKLRQDGGNPPNLVFFENKIVESVTANDISFTTALKYDYDDRWFSFAFDLSINPDHTYGEPTITKYDAGNHIATRTMIVEDIAIGSNPNEPIRKFFLKAANYSRMTRCKIIEDLSPAWTNSVIVEDSVIERTSEIDKVINSCIYRRNTIGGDSQVGNSTIGGATGVRFALFEHNEIYGRVRVTPIDSAIVRQNRIVGGSTLTTERVRHGNEMSTRKLIFEDNYIDGVLTRDVTVVDPIGELNTITIDSVNGNGDFLVVDNPTNRERVLSDMHFGVVVFKRDGSFYGKVTNHYHDGANFVVEGTWEDELAALDELSFYQVLSWSALGNFDGSVRSGLSTSRPRAELFLADQETPYYEVTWASSQSLFQKIAQSRSVFGIIQEIEVYITKPYTGPSVAGIQLQVIRKINGVSVPGGQRQVIDLRTTGLRRISVDPTSTTTPLGADVFIPAEMGIWYETLDLSFKDGAFQLNDGDDENFKDLPQGYVKFKILNPRAMNS